MLHRVLVSNLGSFILSANSAHTPYVMVAAEYGRGCGCHTYELRKLTLNDPTHLRLFQNARALGPLPGPPSPRTATLLPLTALGQPSSYLSLYLEAILVERYGSIKPERACSGMRTQWKHFKNAFRKKQELIKKITKKVSRARGSISNIGENQKQIKLISTHTYNQEVLKITF